jgi:hypothetical protein
MKRLAEKFPDSQKAQTFFEEIHKEKPRYIRDQLTLIEASVESVNSRTIKKALDYCISHKLISAVDFKDAVKHYAVMTEEKGQPPNISNPPITGLTETASSKIGVKPRIRDISEYVKIMSEDHGG